MKEIAFDTLTMMPKDSFVLIDIRDEGMTSYPSNVPDPGKRYLRMERLQ